MVKKSIMVFVIMVSGILSCCTDVIPHWDINDFIIKFDDGTDRNVEAGTFDADSLIIQTALEVEYLSSIWKNNPFANNALALSCEPDGHKGLKDNMTNITFTSNQDFDDISAGNSLNSLITIHDKYFSFSDTSLDNLAEQLNQFYYIGTLPDLEFVIKEKPSNSSVLRFTVSMEFESGKNITVTSNEITWN